MCGKLDRIESQEHNPVGEPAQCCLYQLVSQLGQGKSLDHPGRPDLDPALPGCGAKAWREGILGIERGAFGQVED